MRNESGAVLVALLTAVPALRDQARRTRIVGGRKGPSGGGLRECRLDLRKLSARLGELLIEVGGRDHGQHITFMDHATDIDISGSNVAGGTGVEGGTVEGLHGTGQVDDAWTILGFHELRAYQGHRRFTRSQGFARGSAAGDMCPTAPPHHERQHGDTEDPETPGRAPA